MALPPARRVNFVAIRHAACRLCRRRRWSIGLLGHRLPRRCRAPRDSVRGPAACGLRLRSDAQGMRRPDARPGPNADAASHVERLARPAAPAELAERAPRVARMIGLPPVARSAARFELLHWAPCSPPVPFWDRLMFDEGAVASSVPGARPAWFPDSLRVFGHSRGRASKPLQSRGLPEKGQP
jgi:hypothetical protein